MRLSKILVLKNIELKKADFRIIVIGFLILGFLFYGSGLGNDYNIDDHIAFTSNPNALNGLSDLSSIFTSNSFHQDGYSFGYRPIATLSFAIENELFGTKPLISHLINVLLYIFSCILVFSLIKSIFPELKVQTSLAIGLVFLAMPIHSEIANNVKCRDELLMLVFGLGSTLLFLNSLNKKLWITLPAFIFLLCSILSKKTGVVFLGIIPLSIFFHQDYSFKKLLNRSLIVLVSFPLVRLFRRSTKAEINVREYNLIESPQFDSTIEVDQLSLAANSIGFYIKKLTIPTELVSYYGYNTIEYQGYSITSIVGIVIFIAMLVLGFTAIKKKSIISFGAAIFIGGIIPLTNWFTPLVGIVAERFATLASIGWAIILTIGISFIVKRVLPGKNKLALLTLFIVFLGISLFQVNSRNQEWKDRFTLFKADVKKEPDSATLQALVGKEYLAMAQKSTNNIEKVRFGNIAISHLEKSVEIVPDNYVLTDLAGLYFRAQGNYDLAKKIYEQVIESMPEYPDPYYNLGWVYLEKNQTKKAFQNFETAAKLKPDFLNNFEPVIKSFAEKRNFDIALKLNELGLDSFPNNGIFTLNKANIYYLMKNKEKALIWFKKSVKFYPNRTDIKKNIEALETNKIY